MKAALFLLAFSLPLAATAQKLEATAPAAIYYVGNEKAPLYRSAADTASKAGFFSDFSLAPNTEATVVGQFSPRWLVVKRMGYLYLTPSALLTSAAAPTKAPVLPDGTVLPFDEATHLITYQGVVEVPGATKDQLYTRAYEWMAKTYRSANAVIQMQDKESGRLVGRGSTRATVRGYDAGVVRHTLTLYFKDGRYKYVLTDFAHEAIGLKDFYSGGPLERPNAQVMALGSKKNWDGIRHEADSDARRLVADLQTNMTLKGLKDPNDF